VCVCVCAAVCCSVLQYVAVCCSVLQCISRPNLSVTASFKSGVCTLQCVLQCVAVCCKVYVCSPKSERDSVLHLEVCVRVCVAA